MDDMVGMYCDCLLSGLRSQKTSVVGGSVFATTGLAGAAVIAPTLSEITRDFCN